MSLTSRVTLLAQAIAADIKALTASAVALVAVQQRIADLPTGPSSTTTTITAPVQFSDIGKFMKTIGTWKPSAAASSAVVALHYSEFFIDTSLGNLVGVSHGVGDLVRMELKGGGQVGQAYVRESRYGIKGGTIAGTVYGNTHVFEANTDASGTVSKMVLDHLPDASASATWMGEIKAEYLDPRFVLENKGRFLTANGYLSPPAAMHQAGRWYTSIGASAGGSGGVSQGLVVAAPPIRLSRRTTITKLAIEVTVGQASCVARVGLYKLGADDLPGALLVSANLDASSAGIKTATVSITLDPGLYYPAVVCAGAATNPELRHSAIDYSRLVELYGGSTASPFVAAEDAYLYTTSAGTLPANFGAVTRFAQAIVPMVSISS